MGIGTGNIDIAVQIYPEGIDCIFPAVDPLHLVKEQIHPLAGEGSLRDISVEFLCGHIRKAHGFKIDLDDLLVLDTIIPQPLCHQLHQTGFSAPPNTGEDLDHIGIPKRPELTQV